MDRMQRLQYLGPHPQRNDHLPSFVHNNILISHCISKIPIAAHHLLYLWDYQWPTFRNVICSISWINSSLSHIYNTLVIDRDVFLFLDVLHHFITSSIDTLGLPEWISVRWFLVACDLSLPELASQKYTDRICGRQKKKGQTLQLQSNLLFTLLVRDRETGATGHPSWRRVAPKPSELASNWRTTSFQAS